MAPRAFRVLEGIPLRSIRRGGRSAYGAWHPAARDGPCRPFPKKRPRWKGAAGFCPPESRQGGCHLGKIVAFLKNPAVNAH